MNNCSLKKQLITNFAIVVAIYTITMILIISQIEIINVIFLFFTRTISMMFQIDSKLKYILFIDVIVYDKNIDDFVDLINYFQNVFQNFDITMNISKKEKNIHKF